MDGNEFGTSDRATKLPVTREIMSIILALCRKVRIG